jgi:hypothetical protein
VTAAPASPEARRTDPAEPWYAGGLRFTCTQCGNCCSGAPGYVWATAEEIRGIARRLGLKVEQFMKRHVRRVGGRFSLKEKRGGDCEFLHRQADGRAICSIYEDRPRQCRTWPFWKENLSSPEAWGEASLGCPGMNNGAHHPLPVIQKALALR